MTQPRLVGQLSGQPADASFSWGRPPPRLQRSKEHCSGDERKFFLLDSVSNTAATCRLAEKSPEPWGGSLPRTHVREGAAPSCLCSCPVPSPLALRVGDLTRTLTSPDAHGPHFRSWCGRKAPSHQGAVCSGAPRPQRVAWRVSSIPTPAAPSAAASHPTHPGP